MAGPHMPEELEQLNPVTLQEFADRADEGPVRMLNLLDFKPEGGAERYGQYAEAVEPLLARVGGRLVLAGLGAPALIGPIQWDLVAVVEYPTRQAFLDMIGSREYQAIAHLRSESLERSELHPLDPVPDAQRPLA